MHPALKITFEEQVEFRLVNGTTIDGSVFIGGTEFLPVETLREDPDAYKADSMHGWPILGLLKPRSGGISCLYCMATPSAM